MDYQLRSGGVREPEWQLRQDARRLDPGPYDGSLTLMAADSRTHRLSYVGAGVTLRMPSVTSIKSFANAPVDGKRPGETFDMPVSTQFPGGEISGWVTRRGDGTWADRNVMITGDQVFHERNDLEK